MRFAFPPYGLLYSLTNEPLAKVSLPVILREQSDRRISKSKEKCEILRSAQDDKKAFCKSLKSFYYFPLTLTLSPIGGEGTKMKSL